MIKDGAFGIYARVGKRANTGNSSDPELTTVARDVLTTLNL